MEVSNVTQTMAGGNMENRKIVPNTLSLYKTELIKKLSYHENKN